MSIFIRAADIDVVLEADEAAILKRLEAVETTMQVYHFHQSQR